MPKLQLQGQLLLPILCVMILGILSLQYFSYWESSREFEKELIETVKSERDNTIARVDEWFKNKAANITVWSKNANMAKALEGDADAIGNFGKLIKNVTQTFPDIKSLRLANPNGDIVQTSAKSTKKINVSSRAYFKGAMQGKTYISEPLISKSSGKPIIVIATPVKDKAGSIKGVMYIVTEFQSLYQEVLATVKIGKTGYAFATDKNGLVVGHREAEKIMKDNIKGWSFGPTMIGNEFGQYKYFSRAFQQDEIVVFGTTKLTNWRIGVIAPIGELLSAMKTIRNLTFLGAFITILAVGLVVLFIVRKLTKSIRIVVDNANIIADGSVDITIPDSMADKQDELGELGRSFRTMAHNLGAQIEEITEKSAEAETKADEAMKATAQAKEAQEQAARAQKEGILQAAMSLEQIVDQVASASDELNTQIQESRRGADVQRERVQETATAMEQLNATVLEVAGNAGNAAENADEAQSQAEGGQQVVNKVTDSISELSKEAENLQNEMKELDGQSQSIGNIMGVISDIADQTNLLALNAAIEAARAGEAGRGFAVVADEVRKLAEKTMTATQEVGSAINAIQDSTSKSVDSMEKTTKMVDESTELTGEAQDSLTAILENIVSTADQVRAIATASEEQSAATEQISRGADEINAIASETADAMEQSAIAISELAELSERLRTIIEEMKE
ncbi:methyl-accepting chemotaxis protein [Desulfovibrio sp. JC010]|uniref:methyl-accepting chemotaxis protein n=1 Tax=Desulfovibrio sp. JC010 TaxID=2593641 RepID=UPI0013D10067|nr:methyl-accepting chemotaxis protein [Desulfovibrio sp. JC010]